MTGFEVIVRGERAENHPRRFTRMDVEYVVTGVDIDPAAVARSVDLSRDKYCAVTQLCVRGSKSPTGFASSKSPASALRRQPGRLGRRSEI